MAPSQHDLHGSDTLQCTLFNGQPCALCGQYSNFEPEIHRAKALIREGENKLAEIEARRQLFRANVNDRHDQLAGRLPVEIVAEIFKMTLTRQLMPGLEDHVIDSPLFLGAVCQTWRKIAWSTPALWNWIHIFLRRPVNKHLEETVKQWLERSGTLPLTIQITCGQGVVDIVAPELFFPETGIFGNFVSHVNDCSIRWQNVSFTAPSATTDFLMGSKSGTPNLQVLRVNTTDGPCHHFILSEPSRPHSLAMGELPDDITWYDMNVVWDNLVNLHLEKFTAGMCVRSIQQMPRLTQCVLICDGDENVDLHDPPAGRFIHSNLEKFFYLTKMTGITPRSLFDHFAFPNLTNLHIVSREDQADGVFVTYFMNGQVLGIHSLWEESIKPFMLDSSFELSTLSLQIACEFESFLEVLENINTEYLSKLVLNDTSAYGIFDFHSFLVHLANTPPNSPEEDDPSPEFLPSLQSLSISGHINNNVQEKSAFEAILDACGRPSDLRNAFRRSLSKMVVTPRNLPQIRRSKKNLRRASTLPRAGISLQIIDPATGKDVLQLRRT